MQPLLIDHDYYKLEAHTCRCLGGAGLMIVAHINYCWTHNMCSSIAKTHADSLSNYIGYLGRQRNKQLLPTENDSVNTVQLLLGVRQIV